MQANATSPDPEVTYSVSEAAERCHVTEETMRRWLMNGCPWLGRKLNSHRRGNRQVRRIDCQEVERVLEAMAKQQTQDAEERQSWVGMNDAARQLGVAYSTVFRW